MKLIKIEGNLLSHPAMFLRAIGHLEDLKNTDTTVVVTGSSETETALLDILQSARDQSHGYADQLSSIEISYLSLTRAILPVTDQSASLSFVKQRFNTLEELCKGVQLLGELPEKTVHEIINHAHILSSYLFAAAANAIYKNVHWTDGTEILVAERVNGAIVCNEEASKIKIQHKWNKPKPGIHVISGSAARDPKGNTSGFGKGGGDLSASFFAGLLNAHEIEIWSSQNTYTTADPMLVKNAKTLSEITYEEAIELSHFENNLVAPAALNNAIKKRIPITIRAFENMSGPMTLIKQHVAPKAEMITGISSLENIALISIEGSGMIGVPGFAKRVFAGLNDGSINVILISQGSSEHSICVAVRNDAKHQAIQMLEHTFEKEISNGIIQPIGASGDVSIIGLVGENMRNHPGISGRMFGSLGRNGVNVLAIAQGSNERNISAVIHSADRKKAINVLHESFFEDAKKELNLFIVGTGNVGKKLIEQIRKQAEKIGELHKIKMNVVGLCNSRKMIVQQQGIDLEEWEQLLDRGDDSDPSGFAQQMTVLNLRNSVLVDITANEIIPGLYTSLLRKSMSIVACNKIAASDNYARYKELKELAIAYNCKFLFETNVGAALPIISTLNDIIKSGDKINRMEAVLSGTLNFVFNNYDGTKSFSSVVKEAQAQGFTEPDPRLDLSGKDVMRKIMILSREAGVAMEMKDIQCNGFLPESCLHGSVDDFYEEMIKHEAHFKSLLDDANHNNAKLKFVASFENGKAIVGLQQIKPESDMFHLYGKDNIVLYHTERYDQQPLVIKGAGAGAEVTASGVFADTLRTINN